MKQSCQVKVKPSRHSNHSQVAAYLTQAVTYGFTWLDWLDLASHFLPHLGNRSQFLKIVFHCWIQCKGNIHVFGTHILLGFEQISTFFLNRRIFSMNCWGSVPFSTLLAVLNYTASINSNHLCLFLFKIRPMCLLTVRLGSRKPPAGPWRAQTLDLCRVPFCNGMELQLTQLVS